MPWFPFGKKRKIADSHEFAHLARLIDEQLLWAKTYINQHQLSDASKDLLDRLAYIEQRRKDPNFYLAVIGEFDSGKSTFINALISDDLLRHGPVPVTANPTHLRFGKHLDVEATFDGIGQLSLRADKRRLSQAVGALRPEIEPTGDDTHDLIAALTADSAVARGTSDCVITHPGAFLRDGIVIIDTPGLNDTEEREQATIQVIQEEADLCLIIVPATFQSATTFTNFLSEHVQRMLHRCVFVATKIDNEPMEEHERILTRLAQGLERALKIPDPTIYPAGAKGVLLQLQKKPLSASQSYWAEQFEQLRQTLAQRLRQDRQIAVLERLIGLLTGILTDLDGEMAERQEAIEQQAEALRLAAISDLDAFARKERTEATAALDNAWRAAQERLRAQMRSIKGEAQDAAAGAIAGARNKDALKKVAEGEIDTILRRYSGRISGALEASAADVDTETKEAATRFLTRFSYDFTRLQSLTRKAQQQQAAGQGRITIHLAPASTSVTGAKAIKEAAGGGETTGGAVIGGVIGTFAIPVPVVGTAIGAAVGGLLGKLFGPGLDQIKAKVKAQVTPAVEAQFATWEQEGLTQLEQWRNARQTELTRLINNHIEQYRSAYNQVVEQQRQERQRLEAAIATIGRERDDASQRRATLVTRLQEATTPLPVTSTANVATG